MSIGAVSYADNGAVTMTGRGLAGALLRVYLDGAPVTESRIAEDGSWTLDLSGIAGGDRLIDLPVTGDAEAAAFLCSMRADPPLLRAVRHHLTDPEDQRVAAHPGQHEMELDVHL